ncbi:MAG: M20/M25/M40 family metallo-hydrolase [Spirochaetales bacterium]
MDPRRNLDRPVFLEVFLPLFRQLIQNACINTGEPDSGHEDRNIAVLQAYFERNGLYGEVFHARPGRGNLLLRVPGKDPKAKSLMFMGHVDVVPASAADWSVDPFAAEIRDNQVWGRGAVDMLCWTAAQAVGFVEALKTAPEGGYPGDLVFLALADEEASGRWGAQYLVANHWDAVKCDYMVTELGGFFVDTERGPAAFCNLGEKGVAWVKLTARGTPGHGSTPYRADNALLKLTEAAGRLARRKFPFRATPVYRSMARTAARGPLERWALNHGWGEGWALGRVFARDPGLARYLHTASRTTASPNVLRAGAKVNIIADRAELLVDVRCVPGTTRESLKAELSHVLGPRLAREVTLEITDWFEANLSESKSPLKTAIESLFAEAHPGARLADMVIGGVTDGRFWRPRGTTVYGFSLFSRRLTMDAFAQRIHGIDERIDLESLSLGLAFFTELPARFWK